LAALRQQQRNKQRRENERNIKRKVNMALIKVKERKVTQPKHRQESFRRVQQNVIKTAIRLA
jgi:uncharacterized membrane protein